MEEPADGDSRSPILVTINDTIPRATAIASHVGTTKIIPKCVTTGDKLTTVVTPVNKQAAVITKMNKTAVVNKQKSAFPNSNRQTFIVAGNKKAGVSGKVQTSVSMPKTYKVISSSQSSCLAGTQPKQNYVILRVAGNKNKGQLAGLKNPSGGNRAHYIVNTVPRNSNHSSHVNIVVPTSSKRAQSVNSNGHRGQVTYMESLKAQCSKNPLKVVMPTTSTQLLMSKNSYLRTRGLPTSQGGELRSVLVPTQSLMSQASYSPKDVRVPPEDLPVDDSSGLSRSAVDALGLPEAASLGDDEEAGSLLLPPPSNSEPAVIIMPAVPDLPCPDLAHDGQSSLAGAEQSSLGGDKQAELIGEDTEAQADISKFLASHSTTVMNSEALGLSESSSDLSLGPQLAGVAGDAIGEDIMICDNTPDGIELETMAMEEAIDVKESQSFDDVNAMPEETMLITPDKPAASCGIPPDDCDMLSQTSTDGAMSQGLACMPGPICEEVDAADSVYAGLPAAVLGEGSAPQPVDPAECLVCVDSATGRLVYINQEGHAFIDVSETGASPVVSQEELTQAENSIQSSITEGPDGDQTSLISGISNTATDVPGELGAETVVVTTVTPSRKLLHGPAGKNIRMVQCNAQLPLDGDGERLKWPDYMLSDSDGITSLPMDVMVPYVTSAKDGAHSSDHMTCLRSNGELTIREISKREKDRLMKRQQRQSEQFRARERVLAKERMKARRKDPVYRQSEREKDKLRRRDARRNNSQLYAQERERDKVYQRQKRVLTKMSLSQPNVKIVNNYSFIDTDLGVESCLS